METTKNQLAKAQPQNENNLLVFGSNANFDTAVRMAQALASSTMVPQQYQGEKGVANCIVALEMANRMGASPMMVMQNLYIVHGNPGWSSKFLIATLNTCGKFSPLRYEFCSQQGKDTWGCRASAIDLRTGENLEGPWVTIAIAKAEGWYGKSGSKWQTMPELMLRYRAAAFFQRTYAPEISMGMQSAEELHDIQDVAFEEVTARDVERRIEDEVGRNANTQTIPSAPLGQPDTFSRPSADLGAAQDQQQTPPPPVPSARKSQKAEIPQMFDEE